MPRSTAKVASSGISGAMLAAGMARQMAESGATPSAFNALEGRRRCLLAMGVSRPCCSAWKGTCNMRPPCADSGVGGLSWAGRGGPLRKIGLGCLGPSPLRNQRRCTQNRSAISSRRASGTPRLNQLLTCWGVTLRWAAKSEGVKPHSWSRALRRSPDVFMAASVAAVCQCGYEPGVDALCAKSAWL
ncbi:hypothetical protein D3C81_1528590 [compost metagenome]